METQKKPESFKDLPPELQLIIWSFAALNTPYNPAHDASLIPQSGITTWFNFEDSIEEYRQYHILQHTSTIRSLQKKVAKGKCKAEIRCVTPRRVHPLLHTCYDSRRVVMRKYDLEIAFGTLVNFSNDVFRFEFKTLELGVGLGDNYSMRTHPLYRALFDIPSLTSRIRNLAVKSGDSRTDHSERWREMAPGFKALFQAVQRICLTADLEFCPYVDAQLLAHEDDYTVPLCAPGLRGCRGLREYLDSTNVRLHHILNLEGDWDFIEPPTRNGVLRAVEPIPLFTEAEEVVCLCGRVCAAKARYDAWVSRRFSRREVCYHLRAGASAVLFGTYLVHLAGRCCVLYGKRGISRSLSWLE